jgi:hypothetical protein
MTNSACAKNNGDGLLYSILCSYFVRIEKMSNYSVLLNYLLPTSTTLFLSASQKYFFKSKQSVNTYSKVTNDASRAGPWCK